MVDRGLRCEGRIRSFSPGRLGILAACAALPIVACGLARAGAFELAAGEQYVHGAFLSDDDSTLRLLYLELTLRRPTSRLSILIPRVRAAPSGNVTLTADGPAIVGAGGPGAPPWQEEPGGERESGRGDIVIREEAVLVRAGRGKRPYLGLVLDLKLPTANHKEGLGTGERDWSAGFHYVQPLGKVVQLQGEASYRFMGDPEGADFKDRVRLLAGLGFVAGRTSYRVVAENITPPLDEVPLYDAGGAPIGLRSVEDRRVVRVEVTRRSIIGESFRLGVVKGLTDGSEDFGVMIEFATGGR
jgi:hypothetical protein